MNLFGYHLRLGLISLRRNWLLSLLMVLSVAFGIGAFAATAGALTSLSGDPLKGQGEWTFHPQVDPTPIAKSEPLFDPPDDLTLRDARALYSAAPKGHRVMTSLNWLPLILEDSHKTQAKMAVTRAATADFFKLFQATFLYGGGWSESDDRGKSQVIVISRALNQSLFGGHNSVGEHVTISERTFSIIGVLDEWALVPRIYDLNDGAFAEPEQIFMPFDSWLSVPQDYGYGPMNCWANEQADRDHNPNSETCTWVQLWVQLSDSERPVYLRFLNNYSRDQKASGRYERDPNVRLPNALAWLAYKRAIPNAIKIQYWVALGLLIVCLLSTAALLGVKFRGSFPELGLRRALGASRRDIFSQLLAEGGLVGICGGLLGLLFGFLGLTVLRHSPEGYARYIDLSISSLFLSLGISVFCTLLATIIPAARAAGAPPYQQLVSN